ncbi:hypothetical protein ANTPLA_LOCUS3212 [Anthophora plagiata]
MYELNDVDSRQLEQIQKYIPTATPEKLRNYQNCMRVDAIVNCAIPVGLLTAAGTYLTLPKNIITPRKMIITGLAGITGYICGKILYAPVCSVKAFGENQGNKRMKIPYASDSVTIYNQEDEEKKYLMHPDKIEEEASWNNYDSGFQNYTSDFDNTSDMQESQDKQLRNKQQHDYQRKRVTYDELWRQHKEEERNATYRDLLSLSSMGRDGPAENERRKVSEELPSYDAEDKIWELK